MVLLSTGLLQRCVQTDPAIKALWLEQYANLTDASITATTTGMFGQTIPASYVKGTARVLEAMGKFRVNWNFDSWAGYLVSEWVCLGFIDVSDRFY